MSIGTWKAKHFPYAPHAGMSPGEALEHATWKWFGMLPENLAEHGVTYEEAAVACGLGFVDSCALCCLYLDEECMACPLEARGDACPDRGSTYDRWTESGTSYGGVPGRSSGVPAMIRALVDCDE